MEKRGISQEGLKVLACVTMLLDHVGAVFYPGCLWLRAVGRLAFPLYCFLLVEGAAHTRNMERYGLRLLIGAVLSEIPFDLLFYGRITWAHQSVMVTLLLGLVMIGWARARKRYAVLPFCVCFFAAEFLNADYGGWGIALIGLFLFTAEVSREKLWQFIGMALIFWLMDSADIAVFGWRIPVQMFGLLAMVPIALYSGRKQTGNKVVQWGFYLFYPVHLTVLYWIGRFL